MPDVGRPKFTLVVIRALLSIWLLLFSVAAAAAAPRGDGALDRLTLVVPAAAGGGWDLTAKAMQASLEREGLVGHVDIVRMPGAGGLIGLNQFIDLYRGRGDVLMIGGLVLLGSAIRDQAAINLGDVTPIARLTGDWEVVAVPRDSTIKSISQLRDMMARHPGRLRWAGGALGGADQGLVWSLAAQVHTPIDDILYYAKPGGRNVAQSVADDRSDVGVSGYAEFESWIRDGRLRVLAVAAPHRIDGLNAPTFREAGLAVTTMNWRGVFAPPDVNRDARSRLASLVQAMVERPSWRSALRQNRWTDAYLAGPSFSRFIDTERTRWAHVIDPPVRTDDVTAALADDASASHRLLATAATLLSLFTACVGWLGTALRRRRRDALVLQDQCSALASRLDKASIDTNKLISEGIQQDFGEWNLSFAERDVAWFMLRGLPLKQIADLRGTSERTVRQQAQAIYRKAGLDGRSDLAGRVLERFI